MQSMITEESCNTQLNKLIQELRRGTLVLAVLSQLKTPKYGYSLLNDLGEQGLEIDQGTLYPLLRRLEADDLLESEWNIESSRPRRYYKISPLGEKLLTALKDEWQALISNMDNILKSG